MTNKLAKAKSHLIANFILIALMYSFGLLNNRRFPYYLGLEFLVKPLGIWQLTILACRLLMKPPLQLLFFWRKGGTANFASLRLRFLRHSACTDHRSRSSSRKN